MCLKRTRIIALLLLIANVSFAQRNSVQSEKDYYSMAAFMQGSNRQEYPLDAGGAREGIANEIEATIRPVLFEK